MTHSLLWPVFAMAALTFAVWLRLYVERFGQLRRGRIRPQSVATSAQMAAALQDTRAADNFRNLFELPVLFYAAVFVAHATGQTGTLVLSLCWLFVLSRVVHSAIHCTVNVVKLRFLAYLVGGLLLWMLWAVLAIGLLA